MSHWTHHVFKLVVFVLSIFLCWAVAFIHSFCSVFQRNEIIVLGSFWFSGAIHAALFLLCYLAAINFFLFSVVMIIKISISNWRRLWFWVKVTTFALWTNRRTLFSAFAFVADAVALRGLSTFGGISVCWSREISQSEVRLRLGSELLCVLLWQCLQHWNQWLTFNFLTLVVKLSLNWAFCVLNCKHAFVI